VDKCPEVYSRRGSGDLDCYHVEHQLISVLVCDCVYILRCFRVVIRRVYLENEVIDFAF